MIDICSMLDDVGFEYTVRGNHAILKECPNCTGHDKLWIDRKSLKWVCWSCSKGNSIETGRGGSYLLLTEVFGYDKRETMGILRSGEVIEYSDEMAFSKIGDKPKDEEVERPYQIPRWFVPIVALPVVQRQYVENYLNSRQVSEICRKRFNLMYDEYNYRLAFIIYDQAGVPVGHQARDLTGFGDKKLLKCQSPDCRKSKKFYFEQPVFANCPNCGGLLELTLYPKVMSSYGLSRSSVLFGEDSVRWDCPIVIVEGPFDAIKCPNSLATLGKSVSEDQLQKIISNKPNEIVIYFDGDEAGYMGAVDLYADLSPFVENVTLVPTELKSDPGSRTFEENYCIINKQRVNFQTWCAKIPTPIFSMI